jgi:hypothetical protein
MTQTKEQLAEKILFKKYFEYYRPSFPSDERTNEVVKLALTIKEEKQAIIAAIVEAMDLVASDNNSSNDSGDAPFKNINSIEQEAEKLLLSMMEEKPERLLMYFLSILGREMGKTNATDLQLSQHMDIEGKRYKVKAECGLTEITQQSK